MSEKKVRNSNIELLRIILIVFVLIEHYNNTDVGGGLANPALLPRLNFLFLKLLDAFTACAVDCFFIISGYFLYKVKEIKLRKVLHILFVFSIYRCFISIISSALGYDEFGVKHIIGTLIPNSYFAVMYAAIIILAPFCNFLMEKMTIKNKKIFILLLLILFSAWPSFWDLFCSVTNFPYTGLSTVSAFGNEWGYNIATFLMMYFLGVFIHYCKDEEIKLFEHNRIVDGLSYFALSIFIFLFSFVNKHAMNYCSIFVVFQACLLFLFFIKIHFTNSFVNICAKSVWGIYCIHMNILWFWKFFKIEEYVQKSFALCLLSVVLTVLAVLFSSIFLDKFFSISLIPIYKLADRVPLIKKEIFIDFKLSY